MTGTQRLGLVVAGLVALVAAFLLLRPNGDDTPSNAGPTTTTATAPQSTAAATTAPAGETTEAPPPPALKTISVVNGQPRGGVKTLSYDKGDTVRLRVRSDVADEIHIHGYDLKKDVEAGGSAQFTFAAKIEGKFEIELEDAATEIASLEVNPS
jgi:FtsP/CotA-like multicopper oxidase with cupredoxin domain